MAERGISVLKNVHGGISMAQIEPVVEATVSKQLNKVIAKKTGQAIDSYLNKPTRSIEEELDLNKSEYDDSFTDDGDLGDTTTPAKLTSARGLDTYNDDDKKKLAEEKKQVAEHNEFDIFVDYGNELADGDEGFSLKYSVEMGGTTVGSEVHPFSWEQVQTKYASELGTGKYTIKARNPFTGKIVKTQTKHIHKPINNFGGQSMQASASVTEVTKTQQVIMEKFEDQRRFDLDREDRVRNELKARNEKLEKELSDQRRERETDRNEMLKLIMTPKQQDLSWLKELAPLVLPLLVQKKTDTGSSDKIVDMMFKMQETTNKQIEILQKNMEKSNDRMADMIKEIAQKASAPAPKTDTLSESLKMFTILKGIEDSGFEKFKLMNELANERADEIADQKADAGATKNDSLLDKLLVTAAPLLTGMMMKGNAPALPAPARPVQQAQVLPRPTESRGSLPAGTFNGSTTTTRPGVHQSEARTVRTAPTQAQTHAPQQNSTGSARGTVSRPGSSKGVSGVNDIVNEFRSNPSAHKSSVPATFEERKVNTEKTSHAQGTKTNPATDADLAKEKEKNIEKVMTAITPIALQRVFDDHATVESTATECINALIHEGVNLSSVARDFDEETLKHILVLVPNEYHDNLKDLRDEIIRQIDKNHGVNA